jgi:hypothetical protein
MCPIVEESEESYTKELEILETPTLVEVTITPPETGEGGIAADTVTESTVCEIIESTSTPANLTEVISDPDPIRHPVISTVPHVLCDKRRGLTA